MNRIIRCLIAVLALIVALPLGASAEALAPADDMNVLALVNGEPMDITEAYAEYEYYAYIYQLYGFSEEEIEALKEEVARYYVDMCLLDAEFDKLGLTVDEEAVEAQAAEEYEATVAEYIEYDADEELTDEENRQAVIDYLTENGYTLQSVTEYALSNARLTGVIEHYTGDVTFTEEELVAYYEQRVAEDQAYYEENPAAFEEAWNEGDGSTLPLYMPAGFRTVKHILVMLSDDDQDRMYELTTRLDEIEVELAEEGADEEALNAETDEINAEIDEIMATIMPTVEEIQEKIAAGEDFDALIEEYGEDPGMEYYTEGYLLYAESDGWEPAFQAGAMALENPGDISEPVATSYGLHLIRLEKLWPAGATSLEDARDTMEAELLEEKQLDAYTALTDRLYEEANVELYLDHFDELTAALEAEAAAEESEPAEETTDAE